MDDNLRNGPKRDRPWTMMGTASLVGQVGMILCWYWDGEHDDPRGELAGVCTALDYLPDLLTGNVQNIPAELWWTYYDALGSYPERTPELQEVYEICRLGNDGELPPGQPTKKFCDWFDDDEDD